jgi:hypothetical protein
VASILVEVDSIDDSDFVACLETIGMEEELVVHDISKDLYLSKEMDWDYTMVEETFEHYMHQNFEHD